MTATKIYVPDYNDSFSRIILDGTVYTLRFTWNDYAQFWTFGLYTSLREPILQGIKIVPKYPLNLQFIDERFPKGLFIAYTDKESISRTDFKDNTAAFMYVTAEEGV